jgi:hypothetical protein
LPELRVRLESDIGNAADRRPGSVTDTVCDSVWANSTLDAGTVQCGDPGDDGVVLSVLAMREPPAVFALCSATSVSMATYLVATEHERFMFPGAPTRFCPGLAIVALDVALPFAPALAMPVINIARPLCFMLGFAIPAPCLLPVIVIEGIAWKVTSWIVPIIGIAGSSSSFTPFPISPRQHTRVLYESVLPWARCVRSGIAGARRPRESR